MLHYHSRLWLRLLLVLALYTLCRILFLLFNLSHFSEISFSQFLWIMISGLRFDLSALFMVNALIILLYSLPFTFVKSKIYGIVLRVIFVVFNGIAFLAECIDFIYFRYTVKRMTADVFDFVKGEEGFANLIPQFLKDFWYIGVIWILIILILVISFRKSLLYRKIQPVRFCLISTFALVIYSGLIILSIRGGLQLKPINIITAGKYTEAKNIPLVVNTTFCIIKTINEKPLHEVNYFKSLEDAENIYSPVKHITGESREFRKLNVVIIILESFSKEHSKFLNPDKPGFEGYTPFLDSLMNRGIIFPFAFANGKRSIESLPAILSGIPGLMNSPYITSVYAGNEVNSLPEILSTEGYRTMFFHGCKNGTMGFDDYCKVSHIDEYYGKDEFNDDTYFDGTWGIFDEEFLQYTAKMLDGVKPPFFSTIYTLSSHHPYTIPEKYKHRFNVSKLPIHNAVAYTDFSLGRFFSTISKASWYDSTLFVITADHTAESYSEEAQTSLGNYAIPLIFFFPGIDSCRIDSTVAQHADILPSVLDYLGYEGNVVAYGSSLFDPASIHMAINYYNDIYQLIRDQYVLLFDSYHSTGFYDFHSDPLLRSNLVGNQMMQEDDLESLVKSVIQSYNFRMTKNLISLKIKTDK